MVFIDILIYMYIYILLSFKYILNVIVNRIII